MTVKLTVENVVQAKQEVEKLEAQGYLRDNIYIFAHSEKREDDINEALGTEEAGISEQGFLTSMKNLVNSRGDELRNKLASVGLSKDEAAQFEEVLDTGKLVLVANK
ncbi:general stress protein [Lysinibacillus sp. 38-6]|uniref:general stress protein n=1 Tax=Lysinibacillus sp. 38-6 TaxID=3385991 RepID=UPI00390892AB